MSNDELRFVHDTRFAEAFSNTDHTVLGKRLAPFCLWHQLNLELAQAKVLTGQPMTPFDLWVAVRICTTPWTPQHRKPDLRPPGSLRFIWDVGRFNFRSEVAKFSAYLEDYSTGPRFWPNQHEDRQGAGDRDIDDTLEAALHLVREGKFSWCEAWTMPLGMARWAGVGLSKLSGAKLDIWTDQHEARFQEHKKAREAKIDARGREIAAAENISFEAARQKAHKEHWDRVAENRAVAKALSKSAPDR